MLHLKFSSSGIACPNVPEGSSKAVGRNDEEGAAAAEEVKKKAYLRKRPNEVTRH